MQSGFCTNCGQPLAPGAAFCPSCGTRAEASSAASSMPPVATQGSMPGYTPGSTPPAYAPSTMSPQAAPPPKAPRSRTRSLVGWIGGCLAATLIVVLLLIGALVYGITTGHPLFFFIGLIGLALIILVGAAVEHIIRRLIHRATGGIENMERDVLGGAGAGPRPYQGGARQYRRQQPHFNPLRFVFTLVLLAAAIYGGLFLYYTATFTGDWSGVLSMGAAKQGVLVNLQIGSVGFHNIHYVASDPGTLDPLVVNFKPATAQACKNGPGYQLSGTAMKLDASVVSMTLTIANTPVNLSGTYLNGIFTLSGQHGQQPVTLTLQKGTEQAGYVAACG